MLLAATDTFTALAQLGGSLVIASFALTGTIYAVKHNIVPPGIRKPPAPQDDDRGDDDGTQAWRDSTNRQLGDLNARVEVLERGMRHHHPDAEPG